MRTNEEKCRQFAFWEALHFLFLLCMLLALKIRRNTILRHYHHHLLLLLLLHCQNRKEIPLNHHGFVGDQLFAAFLLDHGVLVGVACFIPFQVCERKAQFLVHFLELQAVASGPSEFHNATVRGLQ